MEHFFSSPHSEERKESMGDEKESRRGIPPEYGAGPLIDALNKLATGMGDIRSRLKDACVALWPLFASDLPADMRPRLEAIKVSFQTMLPVGDEGTLEPSIEMMTDAEAQQLAQSIYDLHGEYFRRRHLWDA